MIITAALVSISAAVFSGADVYATVEGSICLDPPQGDVNGDCIVDTADLAAFIAEWLD